MDPTIPRLIGDSRALNHVRGRIAAWARLPELPVLITGETGSGKELVAHELRQRTRPNGPWQTLNCAELQRGHAGVLLFGSVKGTYTGVDDNPGAIRAAQGGTLFLDEIGEMPLDTQAILLRVLANRQVRPMGGQRAHDVDVTFLFATHRDLVSLVEAGDFREDLYYRIAGFEIRVPPLRHHLEDLPALAAALAPSVAERLTHGAWDRLGRAPWPGNVRQLRLVLLRTAAEHPAGPIAAHQLDLPAAPTRLVPKGQRRPTLEEVKRDRILEEMRFQSGNVRAAARALACSPTTIYRYTSGR